MSRSSALNSLITRVTSPIRAREEEAERLLRRVGEAERLLKLEEDRIFTFDWWRTSPAAQAQGTLALLVARSRVHRAATDWAAVAPA